MDLQRIRRKVAFERFLARLFATKPSPWVLKGGYALEVRFEISRATKDLDLGTRLKVMGSIEQKKETLLKELQRCAVLELDDHFTFQIGSPVKLIESAPGGGFRFSIRSIVAGRLFVAFALDVGMGDALTPPTEEIKGDNLLELYGISPAHFEAISLEQQFAEKIHAMTVKRGNRENSRVKDLVDVVLLIESGLNRKQVRQCLENTFQCREKLPVPSSAPTPPDSWQETFERLAADCGLDYGFKKACNILSSYWQ
ncbi:nucleotidyl transferase AbiEii/AbiGii toxin family protein [Candidatus Neptunochlamydia vexilliferae]|uniref:Nucleotidyl transferase AbiEii/AbiGii toxin family protein n=1 Tax=Candidatus Neptunichlamydia vexilliferae TaxID=1651774 RepID=A0ABS0B1X7_9BACT|nr:nucleotidyl transferase AbiEii/AbiGii toxin family protein [Candidatus Neptunochlamydia vexilliferae]MBF5059721.1 hypothetical protein [Candidatus Neptunochlamydia vexilliferae]